MNLNKGLVGHWTMDDRDTSGGTLYDRSAYDNHGTIENSPTTGANGIIGEAYDFETDNKDRIDLGILGDEFAFRTGDFTISAWVKFESMPDYSGIIDLGRYNQGTLFRTENSSLTLYTDGNYMNRSFSANNEEWIHFVGARENGTKQLYKDTNSLGTTSDSGDVTQSENSYISATTHTSADENWDGEIADIRVYNRALSQKEISALYNMRSLRTKTLTDNVMPLAEVYETQSYYDSNGHPTTETGLDEFFDTTNSGVSLDRKNVHGRNTIYHGSGEQTSTFGTVDGYPPYLNQSGAYSWKISGTLSLSESGTYTFGVDSDDASDIIINGTNVCNFYEGHGFDGDVANNSGTISLNAGEHSFKARYEEGGGGSGIAVGWQKPSDSNWKIFPTDLLR